MKWFGRDKATVVVASAFLTGAAFAATVPFPDADGSHDIGLESAWEGADPQPGDTVSFAGDVTYLLSNDWSLPGPMQIDGAGKTVFDFSADAKTLSVAGSVTDTIDGRETVLKGGVWSLTGGFSSYLHDYSTLFLDGVTMTASSLPTKFAQDGMLRSNASCVLTNGTKVTLTAEPYFFTSCGTKWSTNNVFLVTGGSEINLGVYSLYAGGTYGSFTPGYTRDNRFVVSGAGSKVYTDGASGHNFFLGYQAGGNTVIVENGGWIRAYSISIGSSGGGVSSSCNTLILRDGGVCTNTQGSAIGSVSGSHSNSVFVLNGGQFNVGKAGMYAQLNVGKGDSSYNTVVLSNGVISARWMDLGFDAASHGNRFEILGDSSKYVCTDGGPWRLFGAGYDNEIVIDHGADFSFALAVNANPGRDNVVAGSNNTFAVRHGSTFKLSNKFTVGDVAKGFDAPNTTVEVSDASTFTCTGDFAMNSVGGALKVTGGSQMSSQRVLFGDSAREYPGMALRVAGADSRFTVTSNGGAPCTTFNASSGLLSVEDGATYETQAAGNANPVTIGDVSHGTVSNRVFVGSGATVKLNGGAQFNFYSSDSEVVISNGTLLVGTTGYPQFNFNSLNGDGNTCVGTNSTLVFQGECPELISEGSMQMHFGGNSANSGTTVRFELPPNGYARAPIRHTTQSWAGEDLKIEVTGVEECQKTIEATTVIPLWEQTYAFQNQAFQHAVERLNPTLPKGCKAEILSVKDDPDGVKYHMVLTVKPIRGLVLIVR